MADTVQTFQLGSSTVVTLPKKLGIEPGQALEVKKEGKKIVLKEKKLRDQEVHKLVEKLAGGLNLKDLTPEQMKKMFEESYE